MRQLAVLLLVVACARAGWTGERPNILFLFTDDHALGVISAYGGPLAEIAPTPNLDRIASEGMRFDECLMTNSICAPWCCAGFTSGVRSTRSGLRN